MERDGKSKGYVFKDTQANVDVGSCIDLAEFCFRGPRVMEELWAVLLVS